MGVRTSYMRCCSVGIRSFFRVLPGSKCRGGNRCQRQIEPRFIGINMYLRISQYKVGQIVVI